MYQIRIVCGRAFGSSLSIFKSKYMIVQVLIQLNLIKENNVPEPVNILTYVKFDVFLAVGIKSIVFWVVMSCNIMGSHHCVKETCCISLPGRSWRQHFCKTLAPNHKITRNHITGDHRVETRHGNILLWQLCGSSKGQVLDH